MFSIARRLRVRGALAACLLARLGCGEQLPVRAYGVGDGLASNGINAIRRDSQGFLWFATREGLSRFDGYEFDTYGRANGLSREWITDFLQTRSGVYWAATGDGVHRFDPSAPPSHQFIAYPAPTVEARRAYVLHEDRAGQVWCGTEGGLFRLRPPGASGAAWKLEPVPLEPQSGEPVDHRIIALHEDRRGNLWIGAFHGLYRLAADGRLWVHLRLADVTRWLTFLEDSQGRLWGGAANGLWRILPEGAGYRFLPMSLPGQQPFVWQILEKPDGKLWLATSKGLGEWMPSPDGLSGAVRMYDASNGFNLSSVKSLAFDREGNLWAGSGDGGAIRLARHGFVTYPAPDRAIRTDATPTLFRDRAGEVGVATYQVLNLIRGAQFMEVIPPIPRNIKKFGWGWHQAVFQDHTGEWWFPTAQGLVRFPSVPVERLPQTQPKAIYTTRDGLRTDEIFRLFEDSKGGIWIAAIGPFGINGLHRWDRSSNTIRTFDNPVPTVASAFAEDREGAIWVGFYTGGLARIRGGSMTFYPPEQGPAGGGVQALHVDRSGRLWIACLRGLARIDNPSAEKPVFTRFGAENGLSSNVMLCIAEDRWGRIYLATGRAIDRVDADAQIAPQRVRHYTEADGLAKGDLIDLMLDGSGVLWCVSAQGLSRFVPERDTSIEAPPVFIRALRVRGVPWPAIGMGAPALPSLRLAPDQNQVQIDFTGLSFSPGEILRYQYKLEPADRDWSVPSEQRTVNYSNVAPGRYRFVVRLLTADGAASARPAVLEFQVRAAVWQQWWFRAMLALAATAIAYLLHRYRTSRAIELERVRTRIAADLHDDIGSGLSQIAVLSEVAGTQVDERKIELKSALANIASVSRELAESMSDIVWSVNPERDHLSDLIQRMRRFSSDVLSAKNIDFHFRAPGHDQQARIDTEVRREVYLIFKEAVNNVLRHSGCTRAEIEISIDGGWLELLVEDNGGGLRCNGNGNDNGGGHGLKSMVERARQIGGTIDFAPGQYGGLRLRLRAPVRNSGISVSTAT